MSWAEEELKTLDLGDARLDRRAVLLLERLSQKPSASIPGACESWAAAAYRFLRNEEVSWDKVLESHWQASQARMGQHPVVLCLQDTTELDYNGQGIQGLGPLSYEAQRGLYLHPTYVVSTQRGCDQITQQCETDAYAAKVSSGFRVPLGHPIFCITRS